MQYSPIWDKYINVRPSVWEVDTPKYNPQNLPKFQDYHNNVSFNNSKEVVSPPLQKRGVMLNNNYEHIDTLQVAKKSPSLNRITDFSKSRSVPKKMWNRLENGLNYMSENEYGKEILKKIPQKSIHFKYLELQQNPGQICWPESSISYSNLNPSLDVQIEEIIHAAQLNFYNSIGKNTKYIPSINLEVEAKIGEDIIRQKNFINSIYEDDLFFPGNKIFLNVSVSEGKINELWNLYQKMIERVAENGYFTEEDLEIYKKIGKFVPKEKSPYDKRNFDETIPPELLLDIFR